MSLRYGQVGAGRVPGYRVKVAWPVVVVLLLIGAISGVLLSVPFLVPSAKSVNGEKVIVLDEQLAVSQEKNQL